VKPEHAIWAAFRLLQLALKHGMTGHAAIGFSEYGLLPCSMFGKADQGYLYGQLALSILEKFQANAWIPRAQFFAYGMINPWVRPLRDVLEPLASAHHAALKTGDNQARALCATAHVLIAFQAGHSVVELEELARSYCETLDRLG
jgi:predicted ATPase